MATSAGTPTPSVYSSRTRWPGAFGAIIETSTFVGRLDLSEVNGEAVREHQRLARGEVRSDFVVIQIALNMIRHQDHRDVGAFDGVAQR